MQIHIRQIYELTKPIRKNYYICIDLRPVRNILKDLTKNCRECKSQKDIVEFLFDRGDFSYTSEYYREIWFFYQDAIKGLKMSKREARLHTMLMFDISYGTFCKVRKRYL